ncbi:CBS domain-containing protein [Striga asiatica]|uniref:CBS domain-containing protein n=1 Tax=Striga asiatica TaxID=4170 RepID=A0A5A7R9K4_STRAF|nr:CBS domain-containing protein [Striga asiatica]
MAKMGKPSRSKKQETACKGKVTPAQIAFIVDRYLSENNYTNTHTAFRSDASSLIPKSQVQEVPKSLLSLDSILDEYITLKEQKVWVDHERRRLEQEKLRVHNLLSGMQSVMNVYNSGENAAATPPHALPLAAGGSAAMASHAEAGVARPTGQYPMYNSPALMSTTKPSNIQKDHATAKRKESIDMPHGPVILKKSRKCPQNRDNSLATKSSGAKINQEKPLLNSAAQSCACDNAPNGSNVVKCLFNHEPLSTPPNASVPKTPPRASSSQTEKSGSPFEACSTATSIKGNNNNNTSPQVMSSNCTTIISSETIRVSPNKQISYYSIEKNQITCSPLKANTKGGSSTKKDHHVRGRLDFGTSEMPMITENLSPNATLTSESEGGDILDLDLDALGLDFNLSEFLIDLDMSSEGLGLPSNQGLDSSPDCHSWSPSKAGKAEMGSRQVTPDMICMGSDSITAMRSVTKCITIVSPGNFLF